MYLKVDSLNALLQYAQKAKEQNIQGLLLQNVKETISGGFASSGGTVHGFKKQQTYTVLLQTTIGSSVYFTDSFRSEEEINQINDALKEVAALYSVLEVNDLKIESNQRLGSVIV